MQFGEHIVHRLRVRLHSVPEQADYNFLSGGVSGGHVGLDGLQEGLGLDLRPLLRGEDGVSDILLPLRFRSAFSVGRDGIRNQTGPRDEGHFLPGDLALLKEVEASVPFVPVQPAGRGCG